jgi:hypothetical protein
VRFWCLKGLLPNFSRFAWMVLNSALIL